MLLNWDVKNVCIVSSQWHIRSTFDLIASLVAVILIAAGYEALRAASRKYELAVTRRVGSAPSKSNVPFASLPLPPGPPTPPLGASRRPAPTPYYPCIHVCVFHSNPPV